MVRRKPYITLMEVRGLKIIKIVLTLLFGIKNGIESLFKFKPARNTVFTPLKSKINYKKNTKSLYIKRIKLANAFFDYNLPCPPAIKNCKELRSQYDEEIKKLQEYKLCTQCSIIFLRQNIIASFDVD